jgi:hypothetical protein
LAGNHSHDICWLVINGITHHIFKAVFFEVRTKHFHGDIFIQLFCCGFSLGGFLCINNGIHKKADYQNSRNQNDQGAFLDFQENTSR